MAMNTWACNKYGGVQTIGLCHGVHWAQLQIIECIEIWAREQKLLGKYDKIQEKDVDFICAGINHQTWFIKINWNGVDFIPLLLEYMEKHPLLTQKEKVRIDVLRRFGYYSTESNGHLSEYLPWYRKRVNEIKNWAYIGDWICGETGGYLRVCTEGRHWFKTEFPQWLKEEVRPLTPEHRTSEHGSYIIEALETGRIYRGHLNVINQGHITNLPDGCVIEIPGYVDGTGVNMPVIGDLPMACAATCSASLRVQQMGMEAAIHGDVTLLKQAMLHDPLVGAVCNPEEVWQMTDEMLVAQQRWLPQYKGEIKKAEARLKKHVKDGTRVKLSKSKGSTRQKVRNNKELARDAAAYHAGVKKEADKLAREKAADEKRMAKSK